MKKSNLVQGKEKVLKKQRGYKERIIESKTDYKLIFKLSKDK